MILNSHTAIYAQNGTIDVGRFVGCEVEIGGGDLLGTTQATYGNFGPHAVEYILRHLGNHFGFDEARGYGIDRDTLTSQFAGHRFGHTDQAGFRGHVVGLAEVAVSPTTDEALTMRP